MQTILQEYIWRWDIEVNHRDVKTLLGVGEAQVRNEASAKTVPAVAVAAYAMLNLAAIQAYGWSARANVLSMPKWRDPAQKKRASTLDLVNELRRELWESAIRPEHLSHFDSANPPKTKCQKLTPSLYSAVFYSTA